MIATCDEAGALRSHSPIEAEAETVMHQFVTAGPFLADHFCSGRR
jgi:hypothetical protein